MRFKEKVAVVTAFANGIGRATVSLNTACPPGAVRDPLVRNGAGAPHLDELGLNRVVAGLVHVRRPVSQGTFQQPGSGLAG